jgi:hypothetical protein
MRVNPRLLRHLGFDWSSLVRGENAAMRTDGTGEAVRSYLSSAKILMPQESTAVLSFGGF